MSSLILFFFKNLHNNSKRKNSTAMYPCSTKTREVLGNLSQPPNLPRPKRFPEGEAQGKSRGSREIQEIFRGRGFCTPRPEGFPEGEARGKSRGSRGAKPTAEENLEGGGDGFPNTSRVLVEHGHSLIITREGLMKILPLGIGLVNTASRDRIGQYYPAGRDGHQIHPCGVRLIDSVNFNPSLVMMRECFVFY